MSKTIFRAFLSHTYKSAETNRYFFELFSEHSKVLFDVDQGTKVTNVTRLERFIRDADAFVGIYALAGMHANDEVIHFGVPLQMQSKKSICNLFAEDGSARITSAVL